MTFKSYFPKAISIIFTFQFVLIGLFAFMKDISFFYWGLFLVPLGILLYFSYLRVTFDSSGIHYAMPPFVNRKLKWSEIEKYEIVKISPLGDFMGWGFRYSSKYGWSYILDTNYAIAIQKKNGKKIALSIGDKEKATDYLKSIGK